MWTKIQFYNMSYILKLTISLGEINTWQHKEHMQHKDDTHILVGHLQLIHIVATVVD